MLCRDRSRALSLPINCCTTCTYSGRGEGVVSRKKHAKERNPSHNKIRMNRVHEEDDRIDSSRSILSLNRLRNTLFSIILIMNYSSIVLLCSAGCCRTITGSQNRLQETRFEFLKKNASLGFPLIFAPFLKTTRKNKKLPSLHQIIHFHNFILFLITRVVAIQYSIPCHTINITPILSLIQLVSSSKLEML